MWSTVWAKTFFKFCLLTGNNYYRLKMIDHDGTFSYSKIVTLKYSDEKARLVFLPKSCFEKLSVETPNDVIIDQVTFFNKLGQIVFPPAATNNNADIDTSNLQTRSYILKARLTNGLTETHNISISR